MSNYEQHELIHVYNTIVHLEIVIIKITWISNLKQVQRHVISLKNILTASLFATNIIKTWEQENASGWLQLFKS